MIDYTINAYKQLLVTLQLGGYAFQPFCDFIQAPKENTIILRHDVDKFPENSLKIAQAEKQLHIAATYYFRMVKSVYDEEIISTIRDLGHEIGYHYENLSERSKMRGVKNDEDLFELAIDDFRLNLERLRKLYPVKTICMHGSPLSKWDNRDLWKTFNYRDYAIVGDPSLDIDFNNVLYLTDTGRRWDGWKVSVRDKVKAQDSKPGAQHWPRYHSTFDIIEAVERGLFPERVMINAHPQRWHDRPWPWVKELIWQNFKNVGKAALIKLRGSEGARVRSEE